ncbi:hypothetical protein D3C71_2010750 [compost metagenome]
MLQARPEVTGFCRRRDFVATFKVARAIVVHITVGVPLSVAAGHVRRHRHQDVLGLAVVVVTGRDRAFNHVMPDVHVPHRVGRIIIRP